MTTMGLEYEKLLESRRHNLKAEDLGQQEVDVKKYTASFEPRKVAAQEMSAIAQKQNANTNAYTASFKPREVSVMERQAGASEMQAQAALSNAQTNRLNAQINKLSYELDKSMRNAELTMKQVYNMKDVELREFQNETARLSALSNQALNLVKERATEYGSKGTLGKVEASADSAYEEAGGGFWGYAYGTLAALGSLSAELLDIF